MARITWICETSSGSPLVRDIQAAANKLSPNAKCAQENPHPPQCQDMADHMTGQIVLCGTYHGSVPCKNVKFATQSLIKYCSRSIGGRDLVGGKFVWQIGLRVMLVQN